MIKLIIFQEEGDFMQEQAQRYYQAHKSAFDCWNYGEIAEVWQDEDGILCIRYSSGAWYHYTIQDNEIVWW